MFYRHRHTNTDVISFADLAVHKPLHCESCSDANAVQQPQMVNQCPPYTESGKHDRRYKSRWSALDGCSLFDAETRYRSCYFLVFRTSSIFIFISIPGYFLTPTFISRLSKLNSTTWIKWAWKHRNYFQIQKPSDKIQARIEEGV